MDRKTLALFLFGIAFFGAVLRFTGINWDEGHRLHPDERFISMVLSALSPPRNLSEYLDPTISSVSPFMHGFGSYIYGQLPLTILTFVTSWLGMNDYGHAYLVGRFMSASLDTFSILLMFVLGKRLWGKKVGLLGATLYALMPLPIQHAHFMVMESWAVTSWLVTFLVLLWWNERPKSFGRMLAVGVALGIALAVKANSVMLGVFVLSFVMVATIDINAGRRRFVRKLFERGVTISFIGVVAVLSFRFFQPTIFASGNWFEWELRSDFSSALKFQQDAIEGIAMFPPQWQWVGTPRWWFPLKNLVLWGMGPAIGVFVVIGTMFLFWSSIRKRSSSYGLIALFVMGVFLWQGGQFVKIMRYYLPFFPLYALISAHFLVWVMKIHRRVGIAVISLVMISSVLWTVSFTSIYRKPTTRVVASEWIYRNIPFGDSVGLEEWDDPLPLGLGQGRDVGRYDTFQMPVYAPDDQEKQRLISEWLSRADWIILSSYRAKGSIGRLPDQFPLMNRFYNDLASGTLGFTKAKEFPSYPSLTVGHWSLVVDDSSADESFWIYDHPTVEIYKKVRSPS